MVAEVFIIAAEGDVIGEVALCHRQRIGVVVFVGGFFAADNTLGHANAQSHGLALMAHGVFRTHRPVGAPTAAQTMIVAEFAASLHVDNAGAQGDSEGGTVEAHIHTALAMTGYQGVTDGHVDGGGAGYDFPTFILHLNNRAQRTATNDSLTPMLHLLQHGGGVAVPTAQGAQT